MSSLKPKHVNKLIIGIDYGTTFSGVSYVTTDKSNIDDIIVITDWSNGGGPVAKTPTRIAYASENTQLIYNKWGFDVDPKLVSYSWTKLLLDSNARLGEHDDPALADLVGPGTLKLPDFRDAAGVCEDFLHEVYDFVLRKLEKRFTKDTIQSTPMQCWITLPAIWSDEAKDATLAAARRAGFASKDGDEIFTIAEPEAAAIATLKKYAMPNAVNAIKPYENILICDCGGGTVDITTYTITQVSPVLNFDELCVGIGGKCGSTYIDRNFQTFLSERFGSSFDDLPFAQRGPGSKLMRSFELKKKDFGLNDDEEEFEIGPIRLDVPDSDHYDAYELAIKLTYEDMKGLFDPVVDEITSLLAQQVEDVKRTKNDYIDRIILVGGFSESPYLNNALEDWCQRNGNIMLVCPDHPQSAVVLGAALRGLEGIAPRVKHARYHYGIALNMPFREGIDPENSIYTDPWDNRKLCSDRMEWLISKGDEVVQGTSKRAYCRRAYYPGKQFVSTISLYSCSLNDAPEYESHPRVDPNGVITSTFEAGFDYGDTTQTRYNPISKETVYQFSYEVQVEFGAKGNNLTFKTVVGGKVVSTADISFDQE